MKFDLLSNIVIGCAIDVHRVLGPGLLESAYEQCLTYELSVKGFNFKRQHPMPVSYKDIHLDCGYRVDVMVNDSLIIELKSVDKLQKIHQAQLLTYMKLAKAKVGLLINFNVLRIRDGIKRMVL
ncbi:GxxExxY protein [Desulfatiferula olefinivorans]